MLKRRYIIGMVLTILGLATAISIPITPSLMATEGYKKTEIPFAGMTMAYQVHYNAESPQIYPRTVTFHIDPSEPDCFWVRDSGNPNDLNDDHVWKIDPVTRKVVGEECYSEALFPTNIHIGDEVIAYWGGPVEIVASRRLSVMSKQVNAWVAYVDAGWCTYTAYYEKKTGIWLGLTVAIYETPESSFTMTIQSTNVPFI